MPLSSARTHDTHSPHTACIDLHADGTVRAVHAGARRLLHANADLLWVQDGRLLAIDAAALQHSLARAQAGQPAGLALRRSERQPLTLRTVPLAGGAVRIVLRDPDAEQPDAGLLRDLFALTSAEAHVTACLALGQRTADIAARLDVQANTVQAHLKSVYAKTGCRHQAALLSLVLRSAAMLATPAPTPHPRDEVAHLTRLGIAGVHGPLEESNAPHEPPPTTTPLGDRP